MRVVWAEPLHVSATRTPLQLVLRPVPAFTRVLQGASVEAANRTDQDKCTISKTKHMVVHVQSDPGGALNLQEMLLQRSCSCVCGSKSQKILLLRPGPSCLVCLIQPETHSGSACEQKWKLNECSCQKEKRRLHWPMRKNTSFHE